MSPEAQRIAIAEACGWKRVSDNLLIGQKPHTPPGSSYCEALPDYLNDLNAMHSAEKTLSADQARSYHKELFKSGSLFHGWMWHATAAQRAEAFLRTLNKWDDSK